MVSMLIVDHDDLGGEEIQQVLENQRYPNRCMSPHVTEIKAYDIGDWEDEHPLNQRSTDVGAYLATRPDAQPNAKDARKWLVKRLDKLEITLNSFNIGRDQENNVHWNLNLTINHRNKGEVIHNLSANMGPVDNPYAEEVLQNLLTRINNYVASKKAI